MKALRARIAADPNAPAALREWARSGTPVVMAQDVYDWVLWSVDAAERPGNDCPYGDEDLDAAEELAAR